MMRKTYASLPNAHSLRRRVRVRGSLSMESSSLRVPPRLLLGVGTAQELGAEAGRIYDRSLEGAPRFRGALREYSAQHLVETIIEGLLQLSSKEIEGFSICPLVTESVRCPALRRIEAEIEIRFCSAILTFYTALESPAAQSHDGHLALYRTYYREILLRFVCRRLEERLDPAGAGRVEEFEAQVTHALSEALAELRRLFPLEPYQDRYEREPMSPDRKAELVRRICRDMRADARRRLRL
jgi:hypothetical protein